MNMGISTSSSDPGNGESLRSPLLSPAKQPPAEQEKLLVDDMLHKYCGEFGPWQLRHFVLTSLAWALEAFHTMVMIFADREPEYNCLGQGCDPGEKTVCGLEPGSWAWTGGDGSSTVTQWGLFCEEKYKVGLVQALFFFGCMIGKSFFFNFLVNYSFIYVD